MDYRIIHFCVNPFFQYKNVPIEQDYNNREILHIRTLALYQLPKFLYIGEKSTERNSFIIHQLCLLTCEKKSCFTFSYFLFIIFF